MKYKVNELKLLLEKAITDLPEKQRTVFLMNRFENQSYTLNWNISIFLGKYPSFILKKPSKEEIQSIIIDIYNDANQEYDVNIIDYISEYCQGGELFDYIVNKHHFNEYEAALIFR
jgi:hypothetical protein